MRSFIVAVVLVCSTLYVQAAQAPVLARAFEPTPLARLRNVICERETRDQEDPDKAVSDRKAYGRCQVLLETARSLGFQGSVEELMEPVENQIYGLKWLQVCEDALLKRFGRALTTSLTWCYLSGIASEKIPGALPNVHWKVNRERLKWRWYVKSIAHEHATLELKRILAQQNPS